MIANRARLHVDARGATPVGTDTSADGIERAISAMVAVNGAGLFIVTGLQDGRPYLGLWVVLAPGDFRGSTYPPFIRCIGNRDVNPIVLLDIMEHGVCRDT